jgi:membrane-associated phospholipid phosphatase
LPEFFYPARFLYTLSLTSFKPYFLAGLLCLAVAYSAAGQTGLESSATERPISWTRLAPNIASDQRQIWLFPARVAHGRHWKAVLAVTAVTASLIALDPVDDTYFRRTTDFRHFNAVFSGQNTALATATFPAAFYVAGLAGKDTYARSTALLAGMAVLDSELVTLVMKNVDRRLRPVAIPSHGELDDTWFKDKGVSLGGAGSFPSGHTIAAFSIATVFARRYSSHRWVPYAAYGLAGVIGFSRVSLLSHFPSDVFMGAALGYSISRFAVLR